MALTLAKCPACGAELNLETDRDYFYCPHCGSKVIQQENRIVIEHVSRTVDEAEVQKVELEREKYVGYEARRKEDEQRNRKKARKAMIGGAIVAVIGFIVQSMAPKISDLNNISFLAQILGVMAIVLGFFKYTGFTE